MAALSVGVISLFPEMFDCLRAGGITGRAIERGVLQLALWNPRDYTENKHRNVDDRPYGGGPGMVLQVQPMQAAIAAARTEIGSAAPVILLSPQGKRLEQARVSRLATAGAVILVCGRYEGLDERLVELEIDEEISVGDYVVSGGELPAMLMVDAATRLLPGALGHEDSAAADSFSDGAAGLLDYPHYTRPETIAGLSVPPVLLSGDHDAIRRWRLRESLARTVERRPDLLSQRSLGGEAQELLREILEENLVDRDDGLGPSAS